MDVNAETIAEHTPLHLYAAMLSVEYDILDLLIAKGANVNTRRNDKDPSAVYFASRPPDKNGF